MKEISPSIWYELADLAREFREMAPWRWMYDSDLFGVQHPETGELGFCCIMGLTGEFTGMAVYKGLQGLNSYGKLLIHQDLDTIPGTTFFEQECLMISFNAKEELYTEEQQRLDELNLSFAGDSHWPAFRDYSTGFLPWPIRTESEAKFLLHAMQQAMIVSQMVLADGESLEAPGGQQDRMFVRLPKKNGKNILWTNSWAQLSEHRPPTPDIQLNKLYVLSSCADLPRSANTWLVDIFYYPVPTRENGDRPYFPQILLIADMDSGRIVGTNVFRIDQVESQLAEAFVGIVKAAGVLPASLLLTNYQRAGYWEKIAKLLQLPLEIEENNEITEEIKSSLLSFRPQ